MWRAHSMYLKYRERKCLCALYAAYCNGNSFLKALCVLHSNDGSYAMAGNAYSILLPLFDGVQTEVVRQRPQQKLMHMNKTIRAVRMDLTSAL